jgi:hypothetical protein
MDNRSLLIRNYNDILTQLTNLNSLSTYHNTILEIYKSDDDIKVNNSFEFANSIDNTTNLNYILKSKIKIFSHKSPDTLKISTSLFNHSELTLKRIFNNQEDNIKDLLWKYVHKILFYYKKLLSEKDPSNKKLLEDIDKIELIIKEYDEPKQQPEAFDYINKLLKPEKLNESTNNMINDIIGSFQDALSNNSGNPFQNIMKINEVITEKYKDKIENGDIDLSQIMSSMQESLPGLGEMGGIGEMLSSFTESSKPKEDVIMDENFSTANIEVGKLEDDKPNLMIGNMIKTVGSLTNGLGDLNSLGKTVGSLTNGLGDLNSLGNSGGMPDISKFMGIFNKLSSTDNVNPDELQNIFQNDLGIDMNKLAEQMNEVLKNND